MVGDARQAALEAAQQEVPNPQMIRALIDTGAGITSVNTQKRPYMNT